MICDLDQDRYIKALEEADKGSLRELVDYFAKLQKQLFVSALTPVRDIEQEQIVEQAIQTTRRRLQQRKTSLDKEREAAYAIAKQLLSDTQARLDEVLQQLACELKSVFDNPSFRTSFADNNDKKSHYFYNQIVEVANKLEYFAETRSYRSWARLVMRDATHGAFLVTFHGYGYEFNGLLAYSAIWFERAETGDDGRETTTAISLANEVFVINYIRRRWKMPKKNLSPG